MDISSAEHFFRSYAGSFFNGNPEDEVNLQLKIDHTFRVLALARMIAEQENFSREEKLCTEYAALYHDLSRFEQFLKYRSFRDTGDFDHGLKSAELAEQLPHDAFALTGSQRQMVLEAITFHNKLAVMPNPSRVLMALRDADKLDILALTLQELENSCNAKIFFDLKLTDALSRDVLQALCECRAVNHQIMQTRGDFAAGKLVWIYDLNYLSSKKYFKNAGFLEKYAPFVEPCGIVEDFFRNANTFLNGDDL